MAQKITTKQLRHIYLNEAKKDIKRKTLQTFFIALVAIFSVYFTDAATNHSLSDEKESFK